MQINPRKAVANGVNYPNRIFEEYELTICGHKDILQNAVLTDGKVRSVQSPIMDILQRSNFRDLSGLSRNFISARE
jgi:hypothetical protein